MSSPMSSPGSDDDQAFVSADEASQVGTPSDEAAAGGRHTDPLPAPSPHSVSEADVATGATSPGVREIVTFFEKAAAAQSPTSIFDAARSPLKPLEGLAAALRLTGTPPPADAAAASPIADAAAAASPAEATHLPAPSPPSRAEPPKSKLPTPLPAEPVTPGHTARTPPSAPHTFVSPPAPTPSRIPVRRGSELVSPPLGPWRTPPLVKEGDTAVVAAAPRSIEAAPPTMLTLPALAAQSNKRHHQRRPADSPLPESVAGAGGVSSAGKGGRPKGESENEEANALMPPPPTRRSSRSQRA
ncbi:hypothetical protein EMIHUDRAFT_234324 [Emiliania huxleyi CCMP1516]|uniref:Uncharacterized protein n=2 Tax=Emiliania huxleyi TaxID=2903 RepID=A0A0D3JZN2_EMIH1|nr:hypothetical protein EMIHUDRAFT_234324 [Emiliania huxleyi CCMP1516]EOD28967.1 hypothetical protein EMIHUDRAFT_234324 [Emiliania huxleyi CCMP1516]|eukprot:XP_005781396.1 hypothetical protein EMIHUDRAFT_234324 [Emiliania huxleyi CCMP1516]